jgi:predicted Rossmann-fold nucleotide-binding protein
MGVVSRAVDSQGGAVLGVIPVGKLSAGGTLCAPVITALRCADLAPVELSGPSVGTVRVVPNMHQRKAMMARLPRRRYCLYLTRLRLRLQAEHADAFIALPGGYGTLEEVLEAITWHQLGFSAKPVGFLNVDGFYDGLLSFFEQATQEGFIKRRASGPLYVTATSADALLDALEAYVPPPGLIDAAKAAAQQAGLPRDQPPPDADANAFM